MEGPVRATPEDYDSIVELVDKCFPHDAEHGGMENRWSHVYSTDPEKIRRAIIIKDGQKPVAHVRYVDQTGIINGSELKIAGIHGVCTHPDYRGQGLMSKLLRQTIQIIKEEGYAISDLGGDTPRYRRFGWEDGGREWSFNITARSITQLASPEGWKMKKYSGEKEGLKTIRKLHEAEKFRLSRSQQIYSVLLKRPGKETYLATSGNDAAYVTLDINEKEPSQPSICEFGGNTKGIHSLLEYIFENTRAENLSIESPLIHPANPLFRNLCCGCTIQPMRMIRIFDLVKTLKAFKKQIRNRYEALGTVKTIDLQLVIEESADTANLHINPQEMTITSGSAYYGDNMSYDQLHLNLLEATRLLFGPGPTKLTENLPYLNTTFPLDFYIWDNEGV